MSYNRRHQRHVVIADAVIAELLSDVQDKFKNTLIFDFETIPNRDIYHIGAIFKNNIFERKNIRHVKTALSDLSEFSKEADYILGHNIINHDLRAAGDAFPEAGFLKLPVIDTLFLSPLAFPENPYHKLVKNYKLVKNSKNDPIADAKLAWAVFEDQLAAFLALMEFPYVFILDGGWKHNNLEEERRLFYVGMTRAKKNLYLYHLAGLTNPHIRFLKENSFTYKKTAKRSKINGFSDDLTVSILGMEDLYISYAGYFPAGNEIHRNLSALKTGEKVSLIEKEGKISIVNSKNQTMALLSKKASSKWKHNTQKIISGKVLGIIRRKQQDDENSEYKNIKKESWELPIVEILHQKFTNSKDKWGVRAESD